LVREQLLEETEARLQRCQEMVEKEGEVVRVVRGAHRNRLRMGEREEGREKEELFPPRHHQRTAGQGGAPEAGDLEVRGEHHQRTEETVEAQRV
jgi:hypothetical protein